MSNLKVMSNRITKLDTMQGTAEDIPHPNDLYGFTTLIAHIAMLDYSMLAWINCMLVLNEDMAKERVRV